ncbi:MAG: bifunctional oligoribonuclease/PAP phosphatase NrnA [Bacteroidales bacterium]|nr:bifunctional oligoribonuclease/PAP phosphatase NrnA [Bacteroidales bacterium]
MDKSLIKAVKKLLSDKSKKIVIISHVNPDGDAIGSSLALYHFLINTGFHNTVSISPNSFPSFLEWMPGGKNIIMGNKSSTLSGEKIREADLIFCLDFNDIERTEDLSNRLIKAKGIKILIDHHPDPKPHFDYVLSQISASSTAEMIYEFITQVESEKAVTKSIAECLYTGIVTDTGSFSYGCNNPRTYEIVAHLISLGVDGEKIHHLVYDTYSEHRMRLLGQCLSSNLVVMHEQSTSYIFLSAADLKKFNYQEGDTEGVVNYGLSISGIMLAAIFIERKENIKISFRSQGNVDVNILAREYFNGGGHKNAAGGNFKDTLENTIRYFEGIIRNLSKEDFRALRGVTDNT